MVQPIRDDEPVWQLNNSDFVCGVERFQLGACKLGGLIGEGIVIRFGVNEQLVLEFQISARVECPDPDHRCRPVLHSPKQMRPTFCAEQAFPMAGTAEDSYRFISFKFHFGCRCAECRGTTPTAAASAVAYVEVKAVELGSKARGAAETAA